MMFSAYFLTLSGNEFRQNHAEANSSLCDLALNPQYPLDPANFAFIQERPQILHSVRRTPFS
jgi:hypothetical protein